MTEATTERPTAAPARRAGNSRRWRLAACLALAILPGLALFAPTGARADSPTLAAIRARGSVVCGTIADNPPFALIDGRSVWHGMDVDSCRALAAAVLGDATKMNIRPVTGVSRFPAIQSGEVDVLFGSTTWITTRETSLGLLFAPPNFFSGQGFLVKRSLGVSHLAELNGASICVPPGSTTEVILSDWFRGHSMTFNPILIDDFPTIASAFLSGRCDVFTRDVTGLSGFRRAQGNPDDFVLLPEVITMEPLGGVVRQGDDQWFDVVRWTQFALIWAETNGVTAASAAEPGKTPDTRRLLGDDGDIGPSMGLDKRWAANAIKAVGNYGEMWKRNIEPYGLARGPNNLWDKGGLMYSPPLR